VDEGEKVQTDPSQLSPALGPRRSKKRPLLSFGETLPDRSSMNKGLGEETAVFLHKSRHRPRINCAMILKSWERPRRGCRSKGGVVYSRKVSTPSRETEA